MPRSTAAKTKRVQKTSREMGPSQNSITWGIQWRGDCCGPPEAPSRGHRAPVVWRQEVILKTAAMSVWPRGSSAGCLVCSRSVAFHVALPASPRSSQEIHGVARQGSDFTIHRQGGSSASVDGRFRETSARIKNKMEKKGRVGEMWDRGRVLGDGSTLLSHSDISGHWTGVGAPVTGAATADIQPAPPGCTKAGACL